MKNHTDPTPLAVLQQLDRMLQETSSIKKDSKKIEQVIHNYDDYIFSENTNFDADLEFKKFWMRESLKRSREKNKKDSEPNPEA